MYRVCLTWMTAEWTSVLNAGGNLPVTNGKCSSQDLALICVPAIQAFFCHLMNKCSVKCYFRVSAHHLALLQLISHECLDVTFPLPSFGNIFQQQQMLTFFPQSAFKKNSDFGCFRRLRAKRRMQLCSTLARWRRDHRWQLPCVVPVRRSLNSWGFWL